MISFKLDEIAGVLTVRPEGKLEAQDFQTLSKTVDPFIEEKGKLTGLIIATEKFPGWKDFGGLIEHMKFVRDHHREIARVALVTDSKIADVAQSLGKHFIKASIKQFSFKELESAKSWMSQAP
jgi:hypothetical protein